MDKETKLIVLDEVLTACEGCGTPLANQLIRELSDQLFKDGVGELLSGEHVSRHHARFRMGILAEELMRNDEITFASG